jgi:Secretion system C-terminal sorting domain
MKKMYTALLALGLAITANAQTTFKLDSTFNGTGIFSTNGSAGNNANAFAVGGILNNDGSVWLAGGINGVGNSSWAHFVSRRKANGTADSSFGVNGSYGYQTTAWQTMGFLNEIYPVKNGGAFATHTGYGGYYASSPSATALSKEVYDDFDGTTIVATAQINDSVIVELGSNNIYTYKGTGLNSYLGEKWFDNNTIHYGPLPTTTISPNNSVSLKGLMVQSNQKVLCYGFIDSSNYQIPFVIRLKKNSYSQLDSTFGVNGISYEARPLFLFNQITASYVQNDDKIILHDGWWFIRLNQDGSIDNSFGTSGYIRADISTGATSIYANAFKFVTNATNTELYGITRNFSGDNVVFGVYTNGDIMNSFHAGKNYFRKLDADVNYSGFLELGDISINNNGDLLVTGKAVKTSGGVYEIFAMKLKKGVCNAITATTQQINDTTITITVNGTSATPINIYYLPEDPGTTISSGNTGNIIVQQGNTYTLTIVDANGCQGSLILNVYPTAISNNKTSASIYIYPNPASNYLQVSDVQISNNATVQIKTIEGKTINSKIENNKINIEQLNNGIYFITIKDGANIYNTKFTKL